MCALWHSDIAIALHTPPHRAISLALVAQALGATQEKRGLRRTISDLAEASTNFTKVRATALAEASASFRKGRIGARKTKVPNAVLEVETPRAQDDV